MHLYNIILETKFFLKDNITIIAIVILTILFIFILRVKPNYKNSWCYWTNLKWWRVGAAFSVLSSKSGNS